MPVPKQTGALWGLTKANQFAKVRKRIVDHEVEETNEVVFVFQGNLQPVPPEKLRILREGQRDYKFWSLLTAEKRLVNDDVIADKDGRQYRVVELEDWSYGNYLLAEMPKQGAPAAPYATGAREPIKVLADIIQTLMRLPDEAVVVAYEKNMIPLANGLYVSLDYVGPAKVLASCNVLDPETGAEEQSLSMSHLVQVDVMSYDASARRQKEEVTMALASIYAVQQLEKYTMSLGRNTTPWVDASSQEPTKRLNRFISSVQMFAVHRKVLADAPIFTSFPGALTTGGPLVPFTPAPL